MFKKKLRWYLIFESKEELKAAFLGRSTVVHKSMFGEVLLAKTDNGIEAFRNKCPHQNKPLNGAWVEENYIVCPFHQYHFSCENGRGHGLCLDKYELKFDEDGVHVGKEVWTLF